MANWIQKAFKKIDKKGTRGVCTGKKYGGPSCPAGSKRYNMAKTLRKINKKKQMANLLDWLSKPLKYSEEKEDSSKFDSEGSGYDYAAARACDLKPDETGHWPSRCPKTGQLLKGKKHKTWNLLEQSEREMNYTIFKGEDGKYYSEKIEEE